MNKLIDTRRATIVRALCEGNSVRDTARLMGAAKATVLKLLVELGEFCSIYQDHALRNLNTKRVEADEIWAFCGTKPKNATKDGHGDLWTFTAIDADSKLLVSWLVGPRSPETAQAFMEDVAGRLTHRVQLTTDGHRMYLTAVEKAFNWNGTDYAQLVKIFEQSPDAEGQRRYSPGVCTGTIKQKVMSDPNVDGVSTSYVERANLTMRLQMQMRRFTRLTNGFSKKTENHAHAVSLYFMFYNFCRPHTTLTKAAKGIKTTPAMVAGVTDHVWTLEEILGLMNPNRLLHSN